MAWELSYKQRDREKQHKSGVKLVYRVLLVIVLSLVFAAGVHIYFIVNYERQAITDMLVEDGVQISNSISDEIASGNITPSDTPSISAMLEHHPNVLFYLLMKPGGLVYQSSNVTEVGMSVASPPAAGNTTAVLDSTYKGKPIKLFVTRAERGDIIYFGMSLEEVEEIADNTLFGMLLITTLFVVVAVALSLIVANSIIVPISKIMDGVEEISRGNLDHRIEIKTKDELGHLATAVNRMASDIKSYQAEHEEYRRNLEQKVAERTDELNQSVQEINDARAAALNLLEDTDTARKEAEQAYLRLRDADKLKDEFMNIAAHELKTPLVPIIGYVSMMKDGSLGALTQEERDSLNIITRNVERLKKLIDDILDISKLESGAMKFDMRDVQVTELVQNATQDMQSNAVKKGIFLKAEISPNMPIIKGDKNRLMQVLADLIDNAIKFTDKGGITVRITLEDGKVLVGVTDMGIGIAAENIPKLFTKFYQIDSSMSRRYGGTGLGLVICKKIIEAHGGRIWIESELGVGSTFKLSLPAK